MLLAFLTPVLADGPGCFEAARALPAGAPIAAENVVPTACDSGRAVADLRYDSSAQAALLRTAVPAGGYLGQLPNPPSGRVAKGARLTLRSMAGPVVIEREVTALQAGRSGERIFVRDASGATFAVMLLLASGAAE